MKFFFNMGEGTPFPLDILCKNLVNFYKFSRFISEKINSFYQNMFQLIFEKKKFLTLHWTGSNFTYFGQGGADSAPPY